MASAIRITELANEGTRDLDVAPTESFVRLLAATDAQLFTGSHGIPGVHDDVHMASAAALARAMSAALRHPRGRVLLAGCGTSGRLAHLECRAFNASLRGSALPGQFDYLIAGGDAALLLPQEFAEDAPDAPVRDLDAWAAAHGISSAAEDAPPIVVVGISVGLSATYVGALLDNVLMRGSGWTAAVLGFNPVESVRQVKVQAWEAACPGASFYATLMRMAALPPTRAIVLNPVAGPEAVAGSSRLKGGSLTKVVLESIATAAMATAEAEGGEGGQAVPDAALVRWVRDSYLAFERTVRLFYGEHSRRVAPLIAAAGAALGTSVDQAEQLRRAGSGSGFSSPTGRGRVVYLGAGAAGVIGLIDASECSPTYGSLFNDVRGFIVGGWGALANKEGDISVKGGLTVPPHVRADGSARAEPVGVDFQAYHRDVAPFLGPGDLVLGLIIEGDASGADVEAVEAGLKAAREAGAATSHILVTCSSRVDVGAVAARLEAVSSLVGLRISLPQLAIQPGSTALLLGPGTGGGTGGSSDVAVARTPYLPTLEVELGSRERYASTGGMPAYLKAGVTFEQARWMVHHLNPGAPPSLGELALKLALNAITTGAHAARGTIYRNRMVNVMMTNVKLFHRAVGIVADVASVSTAEATVAVVRAVHGLDADAEELASLLVAPTAAHVAAAKSQLRLVPAAILLAARPTMPVQEAKSILEKEPVIRKALADSI